MTIVLHVDDEYPPTTPHTPSQPAAASAFSKLAAYLSTKNCTLLPYHNFDEVIQAYQAVAVAHGQFPEVVILDLINSTKPDSPLDGLTAYLGLREKFDQPAWATPHIIIYTSADLKQEHVAARLQRMHQTRGYHVLTAEVFVVRKTLDAIADAEAIFSLFPRVLQNRQ